MTFFDALILGIVEGITEFLPVSSTGHLILANKLLGASGEFAKTFEISIQLGAILSVVFLYFKMLKKDLFVWKKIIVAFIPTGILGLVFYKIVKQFLMGNETIVVWSLFWGGLILVLFEWWRSDKRKDEQEASNTENEIKELSYKKALGIGLMQSVSMVPGVSRSAATIIGGMLLGLKRTTAVEFSFLLAIPTMAAATGLDLLKNAGGFSRGDWEALIVGFVSSFIVAVFSIKFLLRFIKKNTFVPFGIYRIAVALVFWLFII